MLEKNHLREKSYAPLICGLPDDLSLLCLARVPRQFHHVLRCVSRRWRALLSSEEWRSCRRKNNLEEAWIYVMCKGSYGQNFIYVLDPEMHSWKHIQAIPSSCLKRQGMSFEAVGKKLYLLGGCSWEKDYADDVYCYDPYTEKWKEASRMPTARCFFLSETIEDKIYVTTGLGLRSSLETWDIYDSQSDAWISETNPMPIIDLVKSMAFDGKIYTFHRTWNNLCCCKVYDPSIKKWGDAHSEILSCHSGPTVVVGETLYMLDETLGTRLMLWQKETEEWVPLGKLAVQVTRPPCQLAVIGRSIFMIGRGLSVVVVDVDKASNAVGGMLTTVSFPPQLGSKCEVVGCTTIAI